MIYYVLNYSVFRLCSVMLHVSKYRMYLDFFFLLPAVVVFTGEPSVVTDFIRQTLQLYVSPALVLHLTGV